MIDYGYVKVYLYPEIPQVHMILVFSHLYITWYVQCKELMVMVTIMVTNTNSVCDRSIVNHMDGWTVYSVFVCTPNLWFTEMRQPACSPILKLVLRLPSSSSLWLLWWPSPMARSHALTQPSGGVCLASQCSTCCCSYSCYFRLVLLVHSFYWRSQVCLQPIDPLH